MPLLFGPPLRQERVITPETTGLLSLGPPAVHAIELERSADCTGLLGSLGRTARARILLSRSASFAFSDLT
jgi:hypothetical protein